MRGRVGGQLMAPTMLNDAPVLENAEGVAPQQGREPVSDDDARPPLE